MRVYKSLVFVFSAVVMLTAVVDSSMAATKCEYFSYCIEGPQQLEIYSVNGFGEIEPNDKVGKIIVIQPGGGNSLINTLILENADPSTVYEVGFSVIENPAGSAPDPFGGLDRIDDYEIGFPVGMYVDGTVTTNPKGRASYLMDLKELPSGEWGLIFWISPCLSVDSCDLVPTPQAATGSLGPDSWGPWIGIIVPEIIVPE